MKIIVFLLCMPISWLTYSQNHKENFRTITTIAQAYDYAADFREVFVTVLNPETDAMFFDDIDTANMKQYVGTSKSFYGKTTKLIKDTVLTLVNVQIITFDLSKTSRSTAELLMSQMQKRLANGESYWEIKKKYGHTSAQFTSSPKELSVIENSYRVKESEIEVGKNYSWEILGSKDKIGILIVEKPAHPVPAFYAISYLNL